MLANAFPLTYSVKLLVLNLGCVFVAFEDLIRITLFGSETVCQSN